MVLLTAGARRRGAAPAAGVVQMPMLALPPKRARPCPGGTDCGKNGFCDFRWGTCMCNFGWKGLDCGTKVAPACELNAGESYRLRTRHVTEIGFWVPASELLGPLACECYRQLEEEEEAGFTTGGGREPERVPSGQICFVRVGGGGEYDPSLQTSAFPTEQEMESSAGEGGAGSGGRDGGSPALRARFLRYGEFKDGLREASVHDYTEASEYGFAWSVRNPRPECTRVAPINECPQSCHYNGRCIDRCGRKECQCNSQTLLDNCAAPCESACEIFNLCSGHGECVAGFCRCHHGHFGVDCSLRKEDLEAAHAVGGGGGKIFVYDSPAWLVHANDMMCSGFTAYLETRDMDYTANQWFLWSLARDPSRQAVLPEDAEVFIVPLFPYYYSGQTADPNPHAVQALEWVRKTRGEFLERNGGHDHAMFFVGDRHSCDLDPRLANITRLVHFGLSGRGTIDGPQAAPGSPMGGQCFRPGTDVVLPGYEEKAWKWLPRLKDRIPPSRRDAKNNLLFFRGGITVGAAISSMDQAGLTDPVNLRCAEGAGDPLVAFSDECIRRYSQGIRFGVWHHNRDEVGVRIWGSDEGRVGRKSYEEYLSEHVFALVSIGHGWGMRVIAAVLHGAIPVFLEHEYHQVWSDLVDPAEYGFVGAITDIPDLVEKLRAVPVAELDAKFQKLKEIAPAFVWGREGRAYDWALRALDKVMAGKRARGDLPAAG